MTATGPVPPAIFLMGPTASGKTEIAVRLAHDLPCDIISVDSALIYRGMDIGTAKPDASLQAEAPHRLIDILDPAESYSAARFREDALREMAAIVSAGRIPLLAGGTMLYFRALQQGLSELPASDPEVREGLEAEARAHGWESLHARLAQVDPQSAARIHPNDPQRIQRALEVYELCGEPLSVMQSRQRQAGLPYRVIKLALIPEDRAALHQRIATRFARMLQLGFVEEVEGLRARGDLSLQMPSMRAVGYRQVWEYLDGECGYDRMRDKGIVATRQLAKRQLTWLRAERDLLAFDAVQGPVYDKILKSLEGALK